MFLENFGKDRVYDIFSQYFILNDAITITFTMTGSCTIIYDFINNRVLSFIDNRHVWM